MKSTGMVRQIDELGRVVIPMEIRKIFEIDKRDPIEIFVDNGCIILKKYQPSCIFCGSHDSVSEYKDKLICGNCLGELKK